MSLWTRDCRRRLALETEREIAKYFHELGRLERLDRSGRWLAGIKDPESGAEQTFRTAAGANARET